MKTSKGREKGGMEAGALTATLDTCCRDPGVAPEKKSTKDARGKAGRGRKDVEEH